MCVSNITENVKPRFGTLDIEFRPFCNQLKDAFSNHEINMKITVRFS